MKKQIAIIGVLCLSATAGLKAQEGFRYPYIYNGNTNIIVSRDSQGGVKEGNIRDVATDPWVTVETTTNPDPDTQDETPTIIHVTPIHTETDAENRVASIFEVGEVPGDEDALVARPAVTSSQYCAQEYGTNGEVWRMPTQRELMLIYVMNDQLAYPLKSEKDESVQAYYDKHRDEDEFANSEKIDADGNPLNTFYWSATRYTPDGDVMGDAWSVCFSSPEQATKSGQTTGYAKATLNFVRCVRDIQEINGKLYAADASGKFNIEVGN